METPGRIGSHAPRWQVRLVAGSSAAIASASAAFLFIPTAVGAVFGVVGIPVGSLLGLIYGPQLLTGERDDSTEETVAGLATTIGTVVVGIGFALQQSRGASVPEVSELAFVATALLGLLSLLLGYPFARLVTRIGVQIGGRLSHATRYLWVPSLMVLLGVGVGTAVVAGTIFQPAGFLAAENGEGVPLELVVHAAVPGGTRQLVVTSYADGKVAGVTDRFGIGDCSVVQGHVLRRGWALWVLGPEESDWLDAPAGSPLVTSSQVASAQRVGLTIAIDRHENATWRSGVDTGAC